MKKYEDGKPEANGTKRPTKVALLVALVAILAGTNLLALANRGSSPKIDWSYGFLSPMRYFVKDKDVIVNVQPLRDYINKEYGADPDVSIYFEFLNTGANISTNNNAEFFPASLLKVPVAMAAIKKIERGEWKWTNELVLMAGDKDNGFGNLYKEPIGTRFTIEKLVDEALINSDNTAYYMLLRNLEADEMQGVWNHLGLQDFFAKDGKISAKRYAVVLRSLYNAAFLTKDDSNKVLDLLAQSASDEYLSLGLPKDMKFAHKIGVSTEENVYMDAGIAYVPDRPYILILMTHGKFKANAQSIAKDISEKAYDYVSKYSEVDK